MEARINPYFLKVLAQAYALIPEIVGKIIFQLTPDHETRSFHSTPYVTGNDTYHNDLALARRKFKEFGLDRIPGVNLEDLAYNNASLRSSRKDRGPPWVEVLAWLTTGDKIQDGSA